MPGVIRVERPSDVEIGARERVLLALDAHDRRRVRRRLEAPDGTVLELALPTGSVIRVGQVLYADERRAYVVSAVDEATLVVRPRDLCEAARAGHLIGNLHRDVDVLEDGRVVALYEATLEARLRAAGFDVSREQRAFQGRAPGDHAH